jgi:predicted restriction endonuclease
MDWQGAVYKPAEPVIIDKVVMARVRKRDHYRCQVIDCNDKRYLSVHHIVPREHGGEDNEENLVLLCRKHHDAIELAGIRTLALIMNFSSDDDSPPMASKKAMTDDPDEPENTDWRTWVYGGSRNPRK